MVFRALRSKTGIIDDAMSRTDAEVTEAWNEIIKRLGLRPELKNQNKYEFQEGEEKCERRF